MEIVIYLTAVMVSIDAMAAGFALAMRGIMTPKNIFIIGGITFLLCMPCAIAGEMLEHILGAHVAYVGGLILILIGLRNLTAVLFPKRAVMTVAREPVDAVAVGVAVGLDAAVANLSLSVMGNHSLLIPVVFALMHIIAVSVGYIALSFFKKTRFMEIASALLLVGIGVYKIFGYFLGL